MPREPENMRDQLAMIKERFPEQEAFNINEVMDVTKKGRKWVKKWIMYDCKNICAARLASRLCSLK